LRGAGKHVRSIVFVLIVFPIEDEQVDFIADGPALVVVLFLTNEAEGLLSHVFIVNIKLLMKIAKIELAEATVCVIIPPIVEIVGVIEVGFRHLVEVEELLSVRTILIVLEANCRISRSVTRLVITEAHNIERGVIFCSPIDAES